MEKDHKIYISDLDGTLLKQDAKLSDFSRKAIITLLGRGVEFTVATARSVTSTKEILGDIPFKLPVICSNGGAIYNYKTLEAVHIEYLQKDLISELIRDIKERNDTAFISVIENGREKVFYDSLPNDGMLWYHNDRLQAKDDRLTLVKDIRDCIDMDITTITFMNRFFHIEKSKQFFEEQYRSLLRLNFFENKYSPGWHWLSMHSPRSTKANAIKKLLGTGGLDHYQVTVFGDELNDLPMFREADKAVAVGNALPSVIEAAHEVIEAHTEDAVVKYILNDSGME